ncbi:MAG TPA: hypothetical protein VFJ82_15945 [Longimicrobium sp.]|nr:hypothetical protein [Longimicrobium sp.]
MIIIAIIIAVIFLPLILILVVAEKKKVYGSCPKCQERIGLMYGIGTCDHCGAAAQFVNGAFATPEPGLVADFPAFKTNLARLRHPSAWSPVWPGRCCVCGAPAIRGEKIRIKSVEGQVGPLITPTNLTHTERFDLGYCAAHRDGVRFWFPPGMATAKSNQQCLLAFRSFDYFQEFLQRNGRAGAVPAVDVGGGQGDATVPSSSPRAG